jgi:hypothetical protein
MAKPKKLTKDFSSYMPRKKATKSPGTRPDGYRKKPRRGQGKPKVVLTRAA